MLVVIPILFRGSKVVIFFYFFNYYQVGPTALLNNVNSLNRKLLQTTGGLILVCIYIYDMLEMIKNQYYGHFSFQKKKKNRWVASHCRVTKGSVITPPCWVKMN